MFIKKIKIYEAIISLISILCCVGIGYYFYQKGVYLETITLGIYGNDIHVFSIILTVLMIFVFIFMYFKKNKNDNPSFHFLEKDIMPTLQQDMIQAEKISFSYLIIRTITLSISFILILLLVLSCILSIENNALFISNSNNQSLFTEWMEIISMILPIIIVFIFYVIIWLISSFSSLYLYKKMFISLLGNQSEVFIQASYLLQVAHRGIFNQCPLAYKMNISAALANLVEFQQAYYYLDSVWKETNQKQKRKQFILIYHYNSYIFSLRLHDSKKASMYRLELLQLFHDPKIKKIAQRQQIQLRLQIENHFQNKEWESIVTIIEANPDKFNDYRKAYYQFVLYWAYRQLGHPKADEIYQTYQDNITFHKLIELESKTIE